MEQSQGLAKNIFDNVEQTTLSYRTIDDSFLYFKDYVIGSGSFGKVLYGMSVDKTKEYAIKFEKSKVKHSVLMEEIKILNDLKGGVGIPNVHWYGKHGDYKVMVMDLLGPSLDKYYKICNKHFGLETTVNLGVEMIKRIEYVHSKFYLHRDIKPNNFLLGKFTRGILDDTVYVIDFGLSKSYLDTATGKHYSYKDDSRFVGTPRYASVNTHMGIRQSRRDDLESIIYLLVYFLKGDLPWQGIRAKTKSEKKRKILKKKKSVSSNQLCVDLPQELVLISDYVKSLKFEEKPNYDLIIDCLHKIAETYLKYLNNEWEWNVMFLSTKNITDTNDPLYQKYKQYYLRLYEGYPVPNYENFIIILDKRNSTSTDDKSCSDEMNGVETVDSSYNKGEGGYKNGYQSKSAEKNLMDNYDIDKVIPLFNSKLKK